MYTELALYRTEAQAAFHAQHGEHVEIGNIHFWSKGFPGTDETVATLQTLAANPEFQQQYPNHRVFVLPTGKVLGALPAEERGVDINGQLQLVASRALLEKAKEERVSLLNCAIILTGSQQASPLELG